MRLTASTSTRRAQRRGTAAIYKPMVVRSSKDIAMTLPVTVDPRYHDAVIFNLDAVLTDMMVFRCWIRRSIWCESYSTSGSPRRSTRCARAVNSS